MNTPTPQDPHRDAQPDPGTAHPPVQDPVAYRLAVGALGIALVAFLIGAAVIAAGGKPVPTQYWATGSGIAGAIIGILAPNPKPGPDHQRENPARRFFGALVDAVSQVWNNRAMLILTAVFGVSIAFAIARNSAPLETVAAAAGGALVGLLAPPPGNEGGL